MAQIQVLDDSTIDKIAAGEVVERPASVVKELVENAIDAGAHAITVEIKDGGIEFIRVTDDGFGIEKPEVRKAFLRHATSKIKSIEDLLVVQSLGFRGEALSSIAAVSRVELITKVRDELTGIRYTLEGAKETGYDEVGAPEGTTFIVRNLFFNTPARRKFLKSPMTEGSYITDLMEHMALSKPMISFKYILNGQTKFFTNGDGKLQAIIYRIYGREISNEMIPFRMVENDITLTGFLGKPTINRSNRNYENYFVNNRYIKSSILSKAIEEGYKPYLMQHKYPFCVLHLDIPSSYVDVNVHPTKMDVRFSNQAMLYAVIAEAIENTLSGKELIPDVDLETEKEHKAAIKEEAKSQPKVLAPEPFEKTRTNTGIVREASAPYNITKPVEVSIEKETIPVKKEIMLTEEKPVTVEKQTVLQDVFFEDNLKKEEETEKEFEQIPEKTPDEVISKMRESAANPVLEKVLNQSTVTEVLKPVQTTIFEDKVLSKQARKNYQIIGQIFDTYWLVTYEDKLLLIDQHAAHEKVKYEQIIKKLENKELYSQVLSSPVIIHVSPKEEDILKRYLNYFTELGFEIEAFGGNSYALRAVPYDLYGYHEKELFEEILNELSETPIRGVPDSVKQKIASMACKAAIKGNMKMSLQEVNVLIDQLLELDNPYHCPHGRPTIVSMSKYEIEKKFKRIV